MTLVSSWLTSARIDALHSHLYQQHGQKRVECLYYGKKFVHQKSMTKCKHNGTTVAQLMKINCRLNVSDDDQQHWRRHEIKCRYADGEAQKGQPRVAEGGFLSCWQRAPLPTSWRIWGAL